MDRLDPPHSMTGRMRAPRMRAATAAGLAALVLAGCSTSRLWPFAAEEGREPVPANATRYLCDGDKSFYLRTLAGGSMWVNLAEREFRLDRQGDAGSRRFGNGVAVLDMSTADLTLSDGPGAQYTGCKTAAAAATK